MRKFAAVVLFALTLTGCKSVGPEYVDADEDTLKQIAPIVTEYVTNDARLDANQKATRLRLLYSWDKRIREAKAALR